ncbi:MAG: hypothetical protein JST39_19160, partial [Bacteroidetes bacterium]|nr:hypothetical protein [Bacteroidota bacterium]
MYKYLLIAGLLGLSACSKNKIDPPVKEPVMDYTELNSEVPFNGSVFVDLDNNGSKD